MGANRGGAQTLTPPTLQGPEPSPLLREVSCPHGCFASHAQLRSGPRYQTETWPTACALRLQQAPVSHLYLGPRGKGQPKEKAVSGVFFPLSSLFRGCLLAVCSSLALALLSLSSYFLLLSVSPARPCSGPVLPSLSSSSFPALSSSFTSPLPAPALLISLPQHPVPSLWCVRVLATARPGRTDGYLLRQRSPWAPTPFPPPGAAQVSRWKVRGAGRGRTSWRLSLIHI